MKTITASVARANLYKLIDEAAASDEPVQSRRVGCAHLLCRLSYNVLVGAAHPTKLMN